MQIVRLIYILSLTGQVKNQIELKSVLQD